MEAYNNEEEMNKLYEEALKETPDITYQEFLEALELERALEGPPQ